MACLFLFSLGERRANEAPKGDRFDNVFVRLALPEAAGGHERAESPGDLITASESARPVSDLEPSGLRDTREYSGPAYAPGGVNNCLSDSLRSASERTLRSLYDTNSAP